MFEKCVQFYSFVDTMTRVAIIRYTINLLFFGHRLLSAYEDVNYVDIYMGLTGLRIRQNHAAARYLSTLNVYYGCLERLRYIHPYC